ncbi:hypothetical protein ACHAAC_09285 [Aeromicrobium sp. CF4.19]|uniref:hypothetical protein n=1 Tax=Aeromicrobium sp. CF4.19 TaxID=3373082 RepID=UPI003EE6C0F7
MTVKLPPTTDSVAESWHALMDLHEALTGRWTVVGGQMVHLHCAEREAFPVRSTDDADALLDAKSHPSILEDFTAGLVDAGFEPLTSGGGHQHRWRKERAQIDVLISNKLGERRTYLTVTGAPTVGTPGAALVLNRSEDIAVEVAGRVGTVRRPTLIGSLIAKAAAHTVGAGRDRHRQDFAVLASMLNAGDLRTADLAKSEKKYLAQMVQATRADPVALDLAPDVRSGLARLELILSR